MRRAMGVTLLIGTLSMAGASPPGFASGSPDATPRWNIYLGPLDAHRVTITTEGGTAAVLELPKGVLVGLEVPAKEGQSLGDALALPSSFRGDIEISVRRDDEVGSEEDTSGREIMAKAPVVLRLTAATIEVARLPEPRE